MEKYEKLELEIISFESANIITDSIDTGFESDE